LQCYNCFGFWTHPPTPSLKKGEVYPQVGTRPRLWTHPQPLPQSGRGALCTENQHIKYDFIQKLEYWETHRVKPKKLPLFFKRGGWGVSPKRPGSLYFHLFPLPFPKFFSFEILVGKPHLKKERELFELGKCVIKHKSF